MRKLVFLVMISVVANIFTSCASVTTNKQQKSEVLERAKKLDFAINSIDGAIVWEMSSPVIKENNPKNEYVRIFSFVSQGISYINSKPTLVVQGKKYAVTQNQVTFTFFKGDKKETSRTTCMRTIWFKYPDNWYWDSMGRTCDYMPSDEDIK